MHKSPVPDYIFNENNTDGSEWDRLDALHHGFCKYMDGRLTFAPIDSPKKILDIGAGSGAWAIQASGKYTDAEIIAADIGPLPMRSFPSNMKYLHCNILKPLDFDREIFDVIHMRSLLYHLPKSEIPLVIENVSHILRPGGWLVIEDYGKHIGHSNSHGPAQSLVNSIFLEMMVQKGYDPVIGEHLTDILQKSNCFSEINVKKVELMLSTKFEGELSVPAGEQALAQALLSTLENIGKQMETNTKFKEAGITSELQQKWLTERQDPQFHTYHDVWFIWSQKRRGI